MIFQKEKKRQHKEKERFESNPWEFSKFSDKEHISDPRIQRTPSREKIQRKPKCILFILLKSKDKEKILKAARDVFSNVVTQKNKDNNFIRLVSEHKEARIQKRDIFKVLKEKKSTYTSMPRGNILQKRKKYKDYLRQTKSEGICWQQN